MIYRYVSIDLLRTNYGDNFIVKGDKTRENA